MKFISKLMFTLLLCAMSSCAVAAGFDCKNAKKDIEILICMDFRLSSLDEQLSKVYAGVVANHSEAKEQQRLWVARRDRCKDFWCVVDAYDDQLKVLDSTIEPVFERQKGTSTWGLDVNKNITLDDGVEINDEGDLVVRGTTLDPPLGVRKFDLKTWAETNSTKSPGAQIRRDVNLINLGDQNPVFGAPIKLSRVSISSAGNDYYFCGVSLADVGLTINDPDGLWGARPERRIQILETLDHAQTGRNGAHCSSEEQDLVLHVMPISNFGSYVWRGELYVVGNHGVLRFDGRLNSYASAIGQKYFLPGADDLNRLLEAQCHKVSDEPSSLGCIDNRLMKLIGVVRQFSH